MQTEHPHSPLSDRIVQRSLDLTRWLFENGQQDYTFPPLSDEPKLREAALFGRKRHKLAASLWQIGLEHHVAIVFLCKHHLRTSAFALARSLFDSTWKGVWIAYSASKEHVEQFSVGRFDPKPVSSLKPLEKALDHVPFFSSLYDQAWNTLCDYNHSGHRQVGRWMGEEEIAAQHSDQEMAELLHLCDQLALTCAVFTIDICDADPTAIKQKFAEIYEMGPVT